MAQLDQFNTLAQHPELAPHLAFTLMHRHPGLDIAFLVDETNGRAFFATNERHGLRPFSAVLNLIQGIYESDPKMARKILRHRIFTTGPHTERDAGAVKVSAKSVTWDIKPQESEALKSRLQSSPLFWARMHESHPPKNLSGSPLRLERNDTLRSLREYFRLAHRLSRIIKREGAQLHELDRPVAAILVSDSGEILCAAVNTNRYNRTRHAEMNLIQRFFCDTGSLIPPGAKIYTTLKPCKMCAGIIHDCAADPTSLQVLYLEDDPGPMARHTVLEAKGLLSGPYCELDPAILSAQASINSGVLEGLTNPYASSSFQDS